MFQLTDITIACQLNDIRPIDFWPKDVVSSVIKTEDITHN
jgi:hypothetical protein